MSVVSLSVPEGWKILSLKNINKRVHVDLGRDDTPAALPLISLEEYPEYIQDALTEAIDDWGNAQ